MLRRVGDTAAGPVVIRADETEVHDLLDDPHAIATRTRARKPGLPQVELGASADQAVPVVEPGAAVDLLNDPRSVAARTRSHAPRMPDVELGDGADDLEDEAFEDGRAHHRTSRPTPRGARRRTTAEGSPRKGSRRSSTAVEDTADGGGGGGAGAIVDKAMAGASYLVLLMTLHRAATFVLNQLLLRYTDPAVFGAASVRLELLLGTALFVAREGVRLALLRVPPTPGGNVAGAYDAVARQVNHAWLTLPFTVLTASFMAALYLSSSEVRVAPVWKVEGVQRPRSMPAVCRDDAGMGQTAEAVPQYRTAVLLYAAAAVIETWFEPVYVLTQHAFQMGVRVGVESAALVARCLATFVLVVFYHQGVLAFGIAQVVNSLVLVAGYYAYMAYHLAQGRGALGVAKARELLPHPTVGAPSYGSRWPARRGVGERAC